jgi:hypothetical protein
MPTIVDYYRYTALAAASYVRMGTGPLTGQRFSEVARDQDRLPFSIAQYLFDPQPSRTIFRVGHDPDGIDAHSHDSGIFRVGPGKLAVQTSIT